MKIFFNILTPVIFSFILIFFSACIGTNAQIRISNDGSGFIVLEYHISEQLENLGRFYGNERQSPIPVGRLDMERTVARIPGLRLISHSSKHDDNSSPGTIHRAELSFESPQALESFFDSSGRHFKIDFPNKKIILNFPGDLNNDQEFKEFAGVFLYGYDFIFSLTVPGTPNVAWLDVEGKTVHDFPGNCSVSGMTVYYAVPMAELVILEKPLNMEVIW